MTKSRPARLRVLGAELAALRNAANLNTIAAAAKAGISSAGLNRIELGRRVPPSTEVAAILSAYNVDRANRRRLMDMAKDLTAPAWLVRGPDKRQLLPVLAQLESEAVLITQFAPTIIPGLMQSPAYLRALMENFPFSGDEAEWRIRFRSERQKVLTKLVSPEYVLVLDEAALRRPRGGTAIMAQQIHWLIGRSKQLNISIHVIPFRYGNYHDPGHFMVLNFRDGSSVVYVEHAGATGFLHEPDDVRKFQDDAARLLKTALNATDSVNFLARIVTDYERS
jgi:transcriptional regulator with XRE-family HTH domain